jgi:hypothetical protein
MVALREGVARRIFWRKQYNNPVHVDPFLFIQIQNTNLCIFLRPANVREYAY